MTSLRRYAILDLDGEVWSDSDDLQEAVREVKRLRREEDACFDFLLVDRKLGPMIDEGILSRRP